MITSSIDTNPTLGMPEALARFSVVSAIQLIGFLLVMATLQWVVKEEWRNDCLWIGWRFGLASLGMVLLAHVIIGLLYVKAKWRERIRRVALTEWIIRILFLLNILALALAMTRSGGPARSLFAQVIPIQLSGILLLEQQKDMMTSSSKSKMAVVYTVFAIIIWIVADVFRDNVVGFFGWQPNDSLTPARTWYDQASTILVVAGMAFNVVAYLLPRQDWFIGWFKSEEMMA